MLNFPWTDEHPGSTGGNTEGTAKDSWDGSATVGVGGQGLGALEKPWGTGTPCPKRAQPTRDVGGRMPGMNAQEYKNPQGTSPSTPRVLQVEGTTSGTRDGPVQYIL